MNTNVNLLNYDLASLKTYFSESGEAPFRASQILKWIYHQGVTDFARMTNLSKSLRATLIETSTIKLPEIVSEQRSADGTCKWVLRVDQNNAIETVFIPEDDRGTLCISSQVGCPLDCKFCSTAQQGFNRNLTTAEIIGQVWVANRELGHFQHQRRMITNIVFMGMGEPLLNYDNVLKAIHLLTDDIAFGLAKRKVTVSTSGIVPEIDRLSQDTNVSLAISLHAVENPLRDQIVPINRRYHIEDLLSACKRYTMANGDSAVTIEYVMLKDVNDKPEHAHKLVKLLQGIPVKINLIPFNRFPGAHYSCSDPNTINTFRMILINAGLIAITRKTRGDDIDAACGQLVGKVQARALRHQKNQPGNRL